MNNYIIDLDEFGNIVYFCKCGSILINTKTLNKHNETRKHKKYIRENTINNPLIIQTELDLDNFINY